MMEHIARLIDVSTEHAKKKEEKKAQEMALSDS